MCTDPQEFADPNTGEIYTVSCRRCDECIATRRHGWVSRAMAEKASNPYAACIALTYSDETPEGRDGARMFCYADVRLFMARLRRAAAYEAKKQRWNIVPKIRFLCAGEQGDRYGRCHWHLIIYSNFDLAKIGKFRLRGHLVTHRHDMVTVGKRKRRLNWSLWPYGFMTLQEPDEGGMAYVLSYCLKDQFTHERSEGTMREAKSENFATGLFRMSKRPAIGEDWLYSKLEALDASGSVLPSLQLKIPDMSGYWHPNGTFREKLLWGLVALNRRAVWATGANAPQWAVLVASLRDNQKDLEVLLGKKSEKAEFDEWFKWRTTDAATYWAAVTVANGNGPVEPDDRYHLCSDDQLTALGLERFEDRDGRWLYRRSKVKPSGKAALGTDGGEAILNKGASIYDRLGIQKPDF